MKRIAPYVLGRWNRSSKPIAARCGAGAQNVAGETDQPSKTSVRRTNFEKVPDTKTPRQCAASPRPGLPLDLCLWRPPHLLPSPFGSGSRSSCAREVRKHKHNCRIENLMLYFSLTSCPWELPRCSKTMGCGSHGPRTHPPLPLPSLPSACPCQRPSRVEGSSIGSERLVACPGKFRNDFQKSRGSREGMVRGALDGICQQISQEITNNQGCSQMCGWWMFSCGPFRYAAGRRLGRGVFL